MSAIFFHPEAYSTAGPKLMGRNAAGESFLRAFLRYHPSKELWVQAQSHDHAEVFAQLVKAAGRTEPVKAVLPGHLAALSEPGSVYFPGPGISEHAWHRSFVGHGQYSLCGITHTTASQAAMDAITTLLQAPVQPWDAVICTSKAVKQTIETVLQSQVNYYQERLALRQLVLPQLPIIPLGIHTEDFVFTDEQRSHARQSLGFESDTVVVLFLGRLSFHAKAHPFPMYQALQSAVQRLLKSKKLRPGQVVLLEAGWHANDYLKQAFDQAAEAVCPLVSLRRLDGRQPSQRQIAWAAADVFCSLSDNLQETFGLTPIEAMAAGLPCLVSDWNGYKDTIRHGYDGYRVPTLMPPAGLGLDLAMRQSLAIDTYDMYCGHSASFVAVDIQAATHAFENLLSDAEHRKALGWSARQRAREVFDWHRVMSQYKNLWDDLNERRQQAVKQNPILHKPSQWPARLDPYHAFSGYASSALASETKFYCSDPSTESKKQRLSSLLLLTVVNYVQAVLPPRELLDALLSQLTPEPKSLQSLMEAYDPNAQPQAIRALLFLCKYGLVHFHQPHQDAVQSSGHGESPSP